MLYNWAQQQFADYLPAAIMQEMDKPGGVAKKFHPCVPGTTAAPAKPCFNSIIMQTYAGPALANSEFTNFAWQFLTVAKERISDIQPQIKRLGHSS
jgi:hypothetical protein